MPLPSLHPLTVPGVIEDLKVLRTGDNKTVFADWGDVVSTPPEGVVARYEIHYRDSQKGTVNAVFHSKRYSYLVVSNVINANSYEVSVGASSEVYLSVRNEMKLE